MHKARIAARSNLGNSWYMTADQVRQQHDQVLAAHAARCGLSHELKWVGDVANILVDYEADRSAGDSELLAIADAGLQVAQQAGFGIAEAIITESIRTWAATAATGAAGGLGLTKGMSAEAQFLGTAFGAGAGFVAGLFIKVEIPIYRLSVDSYGQWMWVAVPAGQAAPVGFRFA